MKKIYFFAFILLNLLSSCSSDNSEETQKTIASFTLSATTVNVGDEIKVTNTSTSAAEIVSYGFSFGNDVISSEKNPTFYYSRPGEYTVTLIIKDANGTVATTTAKVKVTEDFSFLAENSATIDTHSDVTAIEIGIHNNKIFYTETYRELLISSAHLYRHVEYDDQTKTFTTTPVTEQPLYSGQSKTTFLNNGNIIFTTSESRNYISGREVELNSDWSLAKMGNTSQITYGTLQNNDQYYFYGTYNKSPSIEIRNSAGEFVSRTTYEDVLTNAFIGKLIKTGNTYIAFGGKYEPAASYELKNYKPLLLFFNENLEITNQKTFETGSLSKSVTSESLLNVAFNAVKLSNGNLALYSHDELRITTAAGEELKIIKFSNTEGKQGIIEIDNGFIVSSFQKLEKYDNNGNLVKSILSTGKYNTGFVKKGNLIYFAITESSSYQNYSLYKVKLGAVDSNLVYQKL